MSDIGGGHLKKRAEEEEKKKKRKVRPTGPMRPIRGNEGFAGLIRSLLDGPPPFRDKKKK